MRYMIVGFKPYSFTDKKTEKEVTGCNVFCVNEHPESDYTVGYEVDKISLSQPKIDAFLAGQSFSDFIGLEVTPVYNRYAKVDELIVC